jgi:hypothetical protein
MSLPHWATASGRSNKQHVIFVDNRSWLDIIPVNRLRNRLTDLHGTNSDKNCQQADPSAGMNEPLVAIHIEA